MVGEMIYTMGMLSIMSYSEWPICSQIHFLTPLHPLYFFVFSIFFFNYLFIFGCVGSSFLCEGFL